MPRIRRCRVCGEILVCNVCGERQSPKMGKEKKYTTAKVGLTDAQTEAVDTEAESLGMTRSSFIRTVLMGFLSSEQMRKMTKEAEKLGMSRQEYMEALFETGIPVKLKKRKNSRGKKKSTKKN